jgi:hydrogenase small subunit
METLTWLLWQAAGKNPVIPLDDQLRPTWLFGKTVHEGCDRAGYYEQGQFARDYNSPKCQVKVGCWGPVVNCNVPKRGWMGGIGGCPNVGGICIGCTMPGFPDKFMPFMDEPPGGTLSSTLVNVYGRLIRSLREITNDTLNREPRWRHDGPALTTGYDPRWGNQHGPLRWTPQHDEKAGAPEPGSRSPQPGHH